MKTKILRIILIFVFYLGIVALGCTATPTITLTRADNLYDINGLDSLARNSIDSITVNNITFLPPVAPDWSRCIHTGYNQRVVVIYERMRATLHAWFLENNGAGKWDLVAVDKIEYDENDVAFGVPNLEKPLLPAVNQTTTDTVFSFFACLDRSFCSFRYFSFDFSNHYIVQDSAKVVGLAGGQPMESVFLNGDSTKAGCGIIYFSPLYRSWRQLYEDKSNSQTFRRADHSLINEYPMGSVSPVAYATEAYSWVLLGQMTGTLFMFHSGYDVPFLQPAFANTDSSDRPLVINRYCVGDNWYTEPSDTLGIDISALTIPLSGFLPIDVDPEGHIWFGSWRTGKVYVMPEVDFDARIGHQKDATAVHQVLELPTDFEKDKSMVLGLDGSVSERLTVITSQGMETYIVSE